MSRCYIDADYLYATLREASGPLAEDMAAWRASVVDLVGRGSGVVSALVIDELAYRLVLAWLRDDGDPDPLTTYRHEPGAVSRRMHPRLERLWASLDTLSLELAVTDRRVVDHAKALLVDPGFAPRDAFHAAHALVAGCDVIVSSDADYDALGAIRRLGPPSG